MSAPKTPNKQSPESASALAVTLALELTAGVLDVACVDDEQPDTSTAAVTASIPAPAIALFKWSPSQRPCDDRGLDDGHQKVNGCRNCSHYATESVKRSGTSGCLCNCRELAVSMVAGGSLIQTLSGRGLGLRAAAAEQLGVRLVGRAAEGPA
jgi:hypothetical protein